MNETAKDVTGSEILDWGTEREDVLYTASILEQIQDLAKDPARDDCTADHAAFVVAIRGCATGLGLVIPTGADAPSLLLGYLQASREHEGKEQSAAYARGDKPAGIAHGGRRGWLDSACYAITTALRKLDELRTWQERK